MWPRVDAAPHTVAPAEQRVTHMKLDAQKIAAWARTKPRAQEYQYMNTSSCAFAQYLTAVTGVPQSVGGYEYRLKGKDTWDRIPDPIVRAMVTEPYTFGELADRLEAIT